MERLPKDIQEIVQREFDKAATDERAGNAALSKSLRGDLATKGLQFVDVDKKAFRAALGKTSHCGVREHLMGAMANGMAAHGGVIPLAVTDLAFADHERPAMSMAALMGLPVKFVFSHDSIGVGKNGPTHQPVEILASLRAMPDLLVMRPADAVEAAECWEVALEHRSGPVALVMRNHRFQLLAVVVGAGNVGDGLDEIATVEIGAATIDSHAARRRVRHDLDRARPCRL